MIDLARVRRSLRIRPDSKVASRFDGIADEVAAEFSELVEFQACWARVPNEFPEFPGGLARFKELVVAAMTAGEPVSERLSQLTRDRQLFRANVLDAMVNTTLNDVADQTYDEFRADVHASGLKLTRRYSPGCPHMEMEHLPAIIEAADAATQIGVGCTEALMLVPIKSMAYVHGIGDLKADQPKDFCDTCRKISCIRSRRNSDDS